MTTSARVKRGLYPENPPTNEPCAKQIKNGRLVIPAIQSARTNMPLWKAVAFVGGLAFGLYCDPLHAAPSSGGDTVQGLYDAAQHDAERQSTGPERPLHATRAGYSPQL